MQPIIEVEGIRKTYGKTVAVDGVSFSVQPGEIFGIIGPNGAGKTTTVESIIGLRKPDRGRISVLGLDPIRERAALAQRIGVQLQAAALAERMKVWEALDLFSSLYTHTVPYEPLLEQWGLTDKRNATFGNLSGGQKQRLFIALALVNDPEVVFLDELTSGLDPQARRATWELVRTIRTQGKTVVLVTHFMDEAEHLCDRIAIVDRGKIIALDTPAGLVKELDRERRIVFDAEPEFDLSPLQSLPQVKEVMRSGRQVIVSGNTDGLLAAVVARLEEERIPFRSMRTEQADLEDVFLRLTGRAIRAS